MSVTDGVGQTPCSLEHYLMSQINFFPNKFQKRSALAAVIAKM